MGRLRGRLLAVASVLTGTVALSASGMATAQAAPLPLAQPGVTVMTQNLYLGANLTPLFAGDNFTAAAAAVLAHVAQVDFPARAEKIADEIARNRPDLIGLQEVADWQVGPDCTHLGTYVDYLPTLLRALAGEHQYYRVAAEDENFTATVPLPSPIEGYGCAAFTDRDVILARSGEPGMVLWNPQSQEYGAYLRLVTGVSNEMPVSITISASQHIDAYIARGWTSVDVMLRGAVFRFVDTHLEAYGPADDPNLFRDIQAQLLAKYVIDPSPLPVVAVGDYNSPAAPTPDLTGAYGILLGAGLTDAWPLAARAGDPGYTAGQTDDLNNIPSRIDHRIDLVLFDQGPVAAVPGSGITVGNSYSTDLAVLHHVMAYSASTGQYLWPSDHAGVIVTLRMARR